MNETDSDFLKALYRSHMSGNPSLFWSNWATDRGVDERVALRAHNVLSHDGLTTDGQLSRSSAITPEGITFVENSGLLAPNEVAAERLSRLRILKALRERGVVMYDLNEGFGEFARELELENRQVSDAMRYLAAMGCVRCPDYESFSITPKGTEWIERARIPELLRSLQAGLMTPAKRGYALEDLVEKIAKLEGWTVRKRDRTARGEENDLIISKHRDIWVISCKWITKRVADEALGHLSNRVARRSSLRGLLVSMSGFAPAVTENAAKEKQMILLAGPGDVERLVGGEISLDALLTEKFTEFEVSRTSSWS